MLWEINNGQRGEKMSTVSQDSAVKKLPFLRIATEEAYQPKEIPGLYRKLLEEKKVNDPGFLSQWGYFLGNAEKMQKLAARLVDIGEGRIRDMDSTGIARQILSIASPGVQIFDPATGTSLATTFNDELAEAVRKHPDRFSALGAVAPQNPAGAAKELERCVTKLGMKGVIINSNTQGEYLDEPKFYDILAAAEAHDVPIYLHPATPPARMIGPLIERGLEGAFYGFAMETSVHLLRMIMSGVFDRFPKLQVFAGHGGEGLPLLAVAAGSLPAQLSREQPLSAHAQAAAQGERVCETEHSHHHQRHVLGAGAAVLPASHRRGPDALFDGLSLPVLAQGSQHGGQSSHQRCRQEKALPDQRGTPLQAVSGAAWARIWASSSKAKVSTNAGTAIT